MSDVVEGLRSLEDPVTKEGKPIHRVFQGDASAAKNALPALVGQKLDGTLSYLALNDLGQVITETSPDIEARLMLRGKVTSSALGVASTIVDLPLLTSKIYRGIGILSRSLRWTEFQVIHSDAGVDKVLLDHSTLGAHPNEDYEFSSFEFVSGSTGTQKLKLVGTVKEGIATDVSGTLITTEIQDT